MPKYILIVVVILLTSCLINENSKSLSREEIQEYKLNIVISDSAFQKVVKQRSEAIKKGALKSKLYVKALLIAGNDTLRGKVRLKGDHTDHLKGNRWSYRVKLEKDNFVFGERKFSIQGTHTRGHLNEWLFHQLLEYENLLRLQYEFIPVTINGIDSLSGIYAFESHFKSEILKLQNRKVGPILKFNEDKFWNWKGGVPKGLDRDSLIRISSGIQLTNKKGLKKGDGEKAKNKLKSFLKNKEGVEEVFDVEKWAKFIVINGLMASKHALRWHNLRFYYNPESKLLEPIGFDMGSWFLKKNAWYLHEDEMESFYKPFYKSEKFMNALIKQAERLSNEQYVKTFLKLNAEEIEVNVELIRLEKPNYKFYSSALKNSQKAMKKGVVDFQK